MHTSGTYRKHVWRFLYIYILLDVYGLLRLQDRDEHYKNYCDGHLWKFEQLNLRIPCVFIFGLLMNRVSGER